MKNREFVKLALREKSPEDKVAMGNGVYNSMLNSPYFANPDPSLSFIESATNSLSTAIINAANKGMLEQQELAVATSDWDRMINRVASYVQSTADADPLNAAAIIVSAGLELRKMREKKPLPSDVSVVAKFTNIAATIKLLIKGGRNARRFDVYMSDNDSETWTLVAQTSKRSIIIKVPERQTLYRFKVTPYSTSGRGPDSGVASQIAL